MDRLVADPRLLASERQRQLIRFICIEELEGRGDRLKAFTIATQVLGRGSEFDPQSDSIVRVEIGRIRQLLELYYSKVEPSAEVTIVIPKRSYRPVFVDARSVAKAPDPRGWLDWVRRLSAMPRRLPVASALAVVMILVFGVLIVTLPQNDLPMPNLFSSGQQTAEVLRNIPERRVIVTPVRVNIGGEQGVLISALVLDNITKSLSERLKPVKVLKGSEDSAGVNVDVILRTSMFVERDVIRINYILVDAEKALAIAQGRFEINLRGQSVERLGDLITTELQQRLVAAFDRQSDQVAKPSLG